MKLRCVTDSIRLRLSKSDIRTLEEQGKVRESLTLGIDQLFTFSLQLSAAQLLPNISFQKGQLQIILPKKVGEDWIHSNRVGIEYTPNAASTGSIHLLIEKDFPCKDRTDEDTSNTFWELSGEEGKAC